MAKGKCAAIILSTAVGFGMKALNPKTEIEPRMARKGTDEERVMETFSNLFGVSLNP
jgi:hypothetical protein